MTIRYIEVVRRVPLWESIPDDRRLTLEFARADEKRRSRRSSDDFDREWEEHVWHREHLERRLRGQGCKVASLAIEYTRAGRPKYWPCPEPVAAGSEFCRKHGGESVNEPASSSTRRRLEELEAELAAAREQLAEASQAAPTTTVHAPDAAVDIDALRRSGKAFVSVATAAGLFDAVDERTIRAALATGDLPGVKVGRRHFVSVPGLLKLIDGDPPT